VNRNLLSKWWPGTESNRRHGDFQSLSSTAQAVRFDPAACPIGRKANSIVACNVRLRPIQSDAD